MDLKFILTGKQLIVVLLAVGVQGSLSPNFYQWTRSKFGPAVANRLDRKDLGPEASFGGSIDINGSSTRRHRPVILVHGVTDKVSRYRSIREFFRKNGYSDAEIYGTTYGDAGKTNILLDSMRCDYVKQIRQLIMVVSAYTLSKVDIIAYSMGSPIARKAILGGKCVDAEDLLGKPLTQLVDTFVSVAGVNHGSFLCLLPFGSCNLLNGMHCLSAFLEDINNRTRYEGAHIYSIYSSSDDRIGYYACGQLAGNIADEDRGVEVPRMSHMDVMLTTTQLQYTLVTAGHQFRTLQHQSDDAINSTTTTSIIISYPPIGNSTWIS